MRFLLSSCWLTGAGGGWAVALAGLSAGARGANPMVDLIIVGGAASWAALLVTAFRPGKSPNIWQVFFAGASWLMPITMLILHDEFSGNFISLALSASISVTLIVILYPSQSYAPSLVMDQRLQVHLAKTMKPNATEGRESESNATFPSQTASAVFASNHQPVAEASASSVESETTPAARAPVSRASETSSSQWVVPATKRRGTLGSSTAGSRRRSSSRQGPSARRSPTGGEDV